MQVLVLRFQISLYHNRVFTVRRPISWISGWLHHPSTSSSSTASPDLSSSVWYWTAVANWLQTMGLVCLRSRRTWFTQQLVCDFWTFNIDYFSALEASHLLRGQRVQRLFIRSNRSSPAAVKMSLESGQVIRVSGHFPKKKLGHQRSQVFEIHLRGVPGWCLNWMKSGRAEIPGQLSSVGVPSAWWWVSWSSQKISSDLI